MKLLETAVRLVNQPTVGQCSGFFLSMLWIMLLLHQEPTQQSHVTVNHLSFFGLSCSKHLPFTKWKSDVFLQEICMSGRNSRSSYGKETKEQILTEDLNSYCGSVDLTDQTLHVLVQTKNIHPTSSCYVRIPVDMCIKGWRSQQVLS
jgi:hypothetical protein